MYQYPYMPMQYPATAAPAAAARHNNTTNYLPARRDVRRDADITDKRRGISSAVIFRKD